MQKFLSDTVASGTTGGESSDPSKETPVAKKLQLPTSIRVCPYCRRLGPAAHIMRCGQEMLSCPECGAAVEAAKLNAHLAYVCSMRDAPTPCVGCGVAISLLDMRAHLLGVCQGNLFPCAGCSQTFLTSAEYVMHVYSLESSCRVRTPDDKGKQKPLPREVTERAEGKASKKDGGVEGAILMPLGQGKAPLVVHPPVLLRRPAAVDTEPLPADEAEEEYQSRQVRQTSEKLKGSPRQHLTKFLRQRDTSPPPTRTLLEGSGSAPNVHRAATSDRRHHSFARDAGPLALKGIHASASGGHFHARSRAFLKELQGRCEMAQGARQRYSHTVLASAPRLATAELHAKRMENDQQEGVAPKLALHEINSLRRRDALLRPYKVGTTVGAPAHRPQRQNASCPPGHRISAGLTRVKNGVVAVSSEARVGGWRESLVSPTRLGSGAVRGGQNNCRRCRSMTAMRRGSGEVVSG
ncbi:hypothetical protein TraAM80_03129 [Trypanosoma rangeli]|uniref:Uncharacterized protein n=1 Tax=Trypanosoma rangeli TaxID=5698 RepID=A0A422NR03_TRYRA|nr:uncharacterized protein TraAM80_03129 [Trypanosoma rangeli]RNF07871.1 hypothetical protein TraAM80_03129 [Trypanosoma rangeli]|eukprot:RNF07871.1 hypothetical protein TraAM80_03129 [Trypanosoma rangeli]